MVTQSVIRYRPGAEADLPALHALLMRSAWDLAWRIGIQDDKREPSPSDIAHEWPLWQGLMQHITRTADQFWVAEQSGEIVGYARSVWRDGMRELTELFVEPTAQSHGVGRELLTRAMPPGAARQYVIGTQDIRAVARYLKLGLHQVCNVYTFLRPPEAVDVASDLTFAPLATEHLPNLDDLDVAVHGHRRTEDHAWLIQNRSGFLVLRLGKPVGYGYVSHFSGPFVLRDADDYPAVLAHAENLAHHQGITEFAVDVPMLNRRAVEYLLGRGFTMSRFFCFYLCDGEPHSVGQTIVTAPMVLV